MVVRLSNAFKQKRHLGIDHQKGTKPPEKVIKEAKAKHIPLKRLAQVEQATANINPPNSKAHIYHNRVAKVARAEGRKTGDGYSLSYPKEENKRVIQQGTQARLRG